MPQSPSPSSPVLRATSLTRRHALGLIAVSATGIFLPKQLLAQSVDISRLIPADGVCRITPEATEGPFYFDPELVRTDIREDRQGVPVTLQMQVVDEACQPIPEARVDLWHCDALGNYSNFQRGADAKDASNTFLRGTQFANKAGIATFKSIYPGWYPGRTTHMHFKVFVDESNVLTGQIFFPDALSEFIYEHLQPYSTRDRPRDTLNENDFIAKRATHASFAHVKEDEADYLVSLIVGVNPS